MKKLDFEQYVMLIDYHNTITSNYLSHFNSCVIATIETVDCFLVFQATEEEPRNTTQPVKEHFLSGKSTQSESHHPCIYSLLSNHSKIHCPRYFFKYLITLKVASQYSLRDFDRN